MATVRRANVILDVDDSQVERMLDSGYSLIDESGNVLHEAVPHDISALTVEYMRYKKLYEDALAELTILQRAKAEAEKSDAIPVVETSKRKKK